MPTVEELLDAAPARRADQQWAGEMDRSLRTDTAAWLRAADDGQLSRDRSWILLSWVELAATSVVTTRRAELVEAAVVAMSLLEDGSLDRRDLLVVASLVRRAAVLARLDFLGMVQAGCRRAGARGQRCAEWFGRVTPDTPTTHAEFGTGNDFRFERVPRAASLGDSSGGRRGTSSGTGDPRFDADRAGWEIRPWLRPSRYLVLLTLLALAGVGLVTLLYSQGILPIAGPFVAAVVGPVIVLIGSLWRGRRTARKQHVLVVGLRRWLLELDRERVLDRAARSTVASDQSLDTAADTVTSALRQFAMGHTTTGATTAATLAGQTDGWARSAPITRGLRASAAAARRLAKATGRVAR